MWLKEAMQIDEQHTKSNLLARSRSQLRRIEPECFTIRAANTLDIFAEHCAGVTYDKISHQYFMQIQKVAFMQPRSPTFRR